MGLKMYKEGSGIRKGDGIGGIGMTDFIVPFFGAMMHLSKSTWTCPSKIAGTDLSRIIGTIAAWPGAR